MSRTHENKIVPCRGKVKTSRPCPFALSPRGTAFEGESECDACAQLNNARVALVQDSAEVRAGKVVDYADRIDTVKGPTNKVHAVEDVEELELQLQVSTLADKWQPIVLNQTGIYADQPRLAEVIPLSVALRTRCWNGKVASVIPRLI